MHPVDVKRDSDIFHVLATAVGAGIIFSGFLSVRPILVNVISQESLEGFLLKFGGNIHSESMMN